MGTDIKVGDRVRVVIEDEVVRCDGGTIYLKNDVPGEDADMWFASGDPNVVSVEKIEPPVEVFKPGDFVKSKDGVARVYYITQNGYVMISHPLAPGASWPHYEFDHSEDPFDSTEYTKVEMVEKPF